MDGFSERGCIRDRMYGGGLWNRLFFTTVIQSDLGLGGGGLGGCRILVGCSRLADDGRRSLVIM